jgi:putative membrane protein
MKLLLVLALGVLVFTAPACADTPASKLSAHDLAIISHEHAVNQMEISAGQLAEKNSSTKSVQEFGKKLVADHRKADTVLLAFAHQDDAVVGKAVPTTDADRKGQADDMVAMAQLKTMKGQAFESEFLATMIADHEREINNLDTYVSTINDAGLKVVLEGTRPAMVTHEQIAKSLQQAMPQT